jgi:uncharacterized protein (DUF433 family)
MHRRGPGARLRPMSQSAHLPTLGVGLYTIPQAARIAHVPAASIRRWLRGYGYAYKGRVVAQPAVMDAPRVTADQSVISFRDLIEIQFVNAFRQEGVSWSTIRKAAARAREITGAEHPFASSQFVTDGQTIFAEIAVALDDRELLDLRNNQMAFRRVLLPSLKAKLDLGASGVDRYWPMGKRRTVVIDPGRQFGQPIVSEEGVPTEVLAKALRAQGSMAVVASWYAVSRKSVRAAAEFEESLAA